MYYKQSFVMSALRDLTPSGLWKSITGTFSIASGKYKLSNSAGTEVTTITDINIGNIRIWNVDFGLTGAETPTDLNNDIELGLKELVSGAKATFLLDKSADILIIGIIDERGNTQTKNVDWKTAWNDGAPDLEIFWSKQSITFVFAGETLGAFERKPKTASVVPKEIPNIPMSFWAKTTGTDTLKFSSVSVQEAEQISSLSLPLPLESNGAVPINIQDQHSEVLDLYAHLNKIELTIASSASIDDVTITVDDDTGVLVGDILCFQESGRYTQVRVLSILSDVITFDTPLDFAYTTAASLYSAEHDMAKTAGSAGSPIVYSISPPAGVEWDIVRVIFHIEDQTVMDTAKFGGITKLINGVILRVDNGVKKNIINVKTNGEFAERAFDISYDDKAPAGFYGFRVRRTFGGQNKNGVVIRLNGDTDDELQLIIQDDLTDLDHFHCIVQGHVVTD